MRCSSCSNDLDRYLEGTLSPARMRAMAEHLRTCDECRATLDELKVIDALLATTAPVEIAPNFTYAVMAELRTLPQPRAFRFSHWALLTIYTVGAWIALVAFWIFAHASATATLTSASSNAVTATSSTFAALAVGMHALAPYAPFAAVAVLLIVAIDAAFFGAIVFYQRRIRPRVLAAIAIREER
ncbi:MAG: anti-sigma factor family protein [Candidatus Baltobacteraceae bacterium]